MVCGVSLGAMVQLLAAAQMSGIAFPAACFRRPRRKHRTIVATLALQ